MEFLTPLLLKLMPLTTKEVCPFIYIIDTIKTKINIIISKSYSLKVTLIPDTKSFSIKTYLITINH